MINGGWFAKTFAHSPEDVDVWQSWFYHHDVRAFIDIQGNFTERFIRAYHEDCAALGVALANHEPRATEYVPQIVAMVQALIEKGYAYVGGNGDVYYAVARFEPYGRLSGKRLADIADELALSPKTVSVYRARILEKMGLSNNAELTHYAIKHGLVE